MRGEIATRRHDDERRRLVGAGSLESVCVDRSGVVARHRSGNPLMAGSSSQRARADDHRIGARAQQAHEIAVSPRPAAQGRRVGSVGETERRHTVDGCNEVRNDVGPW